MGFAHVRGMRTIVHAGMLLDQATDLGIDRVQLRCYRFCG